MIPPSIQLMIGLFLIGLIGGSTASWYLTAEYKDASWSASINKLNIEAEQALRKGLEAAHAVEVSQAAKIQELEATHAMHLEDLQRAKNTNRVLATQLGGLRDPGRRPSCPGAVSQTADHTGQPQGDSTEGRLSAEASNFLLDFAEGADRAALYAGECKAFIAVIEGMRKDTVQ